MKVKYTVARPHRDQGTDPSFTLGRTYLVLGARFKSAGGPATIIVRRDSDGTPVLVELRFFTVVDSAIPPDWGFFDFGEAGYALEPKDFSGEFWNLYYDADPQAERAFERVIEKLEAFHAKKSHPNF